MKKEQLPNQTRIETMNLMDSLRIYSKNPRLTLRHRKVLGMGFPEFLQGEGEEGTKVGGG